MQKTTFTLAEAADLLVCHKETLRKAILDGALQAARLGRGYRISRADLQKFWTERGGGELFDKAQAVPDETADAVKHPEEAVRVKRGGKSESPGQLTLPTL